LFRSIISFSVSFGQRRPSNVSPFLDRRIPKKKSSEFFIKLRHQEENCHHVERYNGKTMDRAEEAMAEQTATFIPIAESCNDCVFGAHDLERSYVFNKSMSILNMH